LAILFRPFGFIAPKTFKLFRHILKCPKKCLNSENALELSADCMEMILQSDELVLSEAEMFKFVLTTAHKRVLVLEAYIFPMHTILDQLYLSELSQCRCKYICKKM
jgi:hypothetical protein